MNRFNKTNSNINTVENLETNQLITNEISSSSSNNNITINSGLDTTSNIGLLVNCPVRIINGSTITSLPFVMTYYDGTKSYTNKQCLTHFIYPFDSNELHPIIAGQIPNIAWSNTYVGSSYGGTVIINGDWQNASDGSYPACALYVNGSCNINGALTLSTQLTLSCGELYLSTSLSLSLTQNTYSLVGNTTGTSVWTAQNLNRFSNSTQYALTADWSNNNSLVDTIKLSANLSISSSVAGHTFQFVFYINATAISSSVKTITLNDTSTYIVDMSVSYPASYSNYFSIWVEDITGSSTLTISNANFQAFGTTPM